MPPLSYIITALVLAALVAVSFPLTLGFSIILWYWLFAIAACCLAVVGAFRIAGGLQAPRWVGIGLASPGLVWAASHFHEMVGQLNLTASYAFGTATYLASLAAAACAIRLAETVSRPHASKLHLAYRIAYGVLAVAALSSCVNLFAHMTGSMFTRNPVYAAAARTVAITAIPVKYGAFIAAALLIVRQRDVERWTGIVISLVSAYLLYKAIRPLFVTERPGEGLMFWLLPVIMLIGGAGVWRLGLLLRAPAARPSQSDQGNAPVPASTG